MNGAHDLIGDTELAAETLATAFDEISMAMILPVQMGLGLVWVLIGANLIQNGEGLILKLDHFLSKARLLPSSFVGLDSLIGKSAVLGSIQGGDLRGQLMNAVLEENRQTNGVALEKNESQQAEGLLDLMKAVPKLVIAEPLAREQFQKSVLITEGVSEELFEVPEFLGPLENDFWMSEKPIADGTGIGSIEVDQVRGFHREESEDLIVEMLGRHVAKALDADADLALRGYAHIAWVFEFSDARLLLKVELHCSDFGKEVGSRRVGREEALHQAERRIIENAKAILRDRCLRMEARDLLLKGLNLGPLLVKGLHAGVGRGEMVILTLDGPSDLVLAAARGFSARAVDPALRAKVSI